jgi:hypothetical protein
MMSAMDLAVELGNEQTGRLVITDPIRGEQGEIWSVLVRVECQGLTAESRVSAHYASAFDDLIAFLRDLASSWKGWSGEKTWLSLEHDFGLLAVHDGYGHVRLTVTLKGPNAPPAWTVSPEITTDPGAQMSEAAEAASRLLAARA